MDGRQPPRFSSSPKTPAPNIWQLQSRGDIDGLISALHHADAGSRRGAAAALRALGAWHAVPALQAALAIESDWQVYAAISAAIQYLDRDIHIELMLKNHDVKGLIKMLGSNKPEEVITACEALGQIGDRQGAEALVIVFRNSMLPNKVRLAAAEALLKLNSAPAIVTLLAALRRDDWRVRQNAAMILGQLGAMWATSALIKALEDSHPVVRKAAVDSLRRFGSPEALDAIQQALDAENSKRPTQEAKTIDASPESSTPDIKL
jgi:HEAT repeat protein